MRVNASKAFEAFLCGKAAKPAASIHTNGSSIFSYGTELARKLNGNRVALNVTGYSTTTTCHQNALRCAFKQAGFDVVECTGIPFGGYLPDMAA